MRRFIILLVVLPMAMVALVVTISKIRVDTSFAASVRFKYHYDNMVRDVVSGVSGFEGWEAGV